MPSFAARAAVEETIASKVPSTRRFKDKSSSRKD
jgi:hypothetical protein